MRPTRRARVELADEKPKDWLASETASYRIVRADEVWRGSDSAGPGCEPHRRRWDAPLPSEIVLGIFNFLLLCTGTTDGFLSLSFHRQSCVAHGWLRG